VISRTVLLNKITLQSNADHSGTGYTDALFCSCDLDLDPMTSLYKLDILMIYLHKQN